MVIYQSIRKRLRRGEKIMKTTAIIGYGTSGQAVEELTSLLGLKTVIFDDRKKLGRYLADGTPDFSGIEEAVVSPGVAPSSPLYVAALNAGLHMVSEMEFGFRFFDLPLLAITGTNGKTTTTELTAHLLNGLGIKAETCGNIGLPLSALAARIWRDQAGKPDVGVIEVSSFQLECCEKFSPLAAVNLNVTDDHLDRYHGLMTAYSEVKFSIFDRVRNRDRMFLGLTMRETPELIPAAYGFLLERPEPVEFDGDQIYLNGRKLCCFSDSNLLGRHNLENLLAALALVWAYAGERIFSDRLISALRSYYPGDHRIQAVAEWRGITFINDSKATNPSSVLAALDAVGGNRNVCILLGGLDKGMDFEALRAIAPQVKQAFIYGQCRDKMYAALREAMPCAVYDDFVPAVEAACRAAVSGDVVILSPSCASMDMFKNYKERGDIFAGLVRRFMASQDAIGQPQ